MNRLEYLLASTVLRVIGTLCSVLPIAPDRVVFASARTRTLEGNLAALHRAMLARFPEHPGVRSVIVVDVRRISDSCGYAVPRMDYVADRDVLDLSATKKGPEGMAAYRAERNAHSLDGLPGLPR